MTKPESRRLRQRVRNDINRLRRHVQQHDPVYAYLLRKLARHGRISSYEFWDMEFAFATMVERLAKHHIYLTLDGPMCFWSIDYEKTCYRLTPRL